MSAWQEIAPTVNAEAEFFEILNDFGNPLEIVREAISNSIDAEATEIDISFSVQEIGGSYRSVVKFSDNGIGMSKETLQNDFWGLGHSTARGDKTKIGEKGHGTKIYLRSEHVSVRTQSLDGAFLSECDRPLAALSQKKLHTPKMMQIEHFKEGTGTEITVVGYNDNERSKFIQSIAKDYIVWFTKIGSIEMMFGNNNLRDLKLTLKCLDVEEPEVIKFGHIFPTENSDIAKLFDKFSSDAAGLYVKAFTHKSRLPNHPEVIYEVIINVEGDAVKREYNPMLRERGRSATGTYRVLDRYGIWLCKDYIPIQRVNEWISSFGAGSNAFAMLHGFVNCQALKLTANRGTIANTDPKILEELKSEVQSIVERIDTELNNNGLYTLRGWQQEARTLDQEKSEFSRRIKNIKSRSTTKYKEVPIYEPGNESEVFGVLNTLVAIAPELFEFEPLDYNTTKGLDLIVRDKRQVLVEHNLGYAEIKKYLTPGFNHAFAYLRWIICWEFGRNVKIGTKFDGAQEGDVRTLKSEQDADGNSIYWLDAPRVPNKIHVVHLKELIERKLGLKFERQQFL